MWFEIASRNLRKSWRRSLFSVLAICIGFTAVSVFGGFTGYVFKNLADSFIYGMGNGHVTIVKTGFLDLGRIDPVRFLIDEEMQTRLQSELDNLSGIEVVGRQLQIQGLVSNGEISTIFLARGRLISAYNLTTVFHTKLHLVRDCPMYSAWVWARMEWSLRQLSMDMSTRWISM
jgi:putative ABC transport system permease protein